MIEKPEPKLNNPEQEKQKIFLNEIIGGLKEKIKNSIGFLFGTEEDKKMKEFEEKLQKSQDISKAAGEFFRLLIPKSLNKPDADNKYQHIEKEEDYLKSKIDCLKSVNGLRKTMSKKAFKGIQQTFISVEEINSNNEIVGDVEEEQAQNNLGEKFIMQRRVCNFQQEGGRNTIKEAIDNSISSNEDVNYANTSTLIVKNCYTGTELDLKQLLPNEIEFCPSDLNKIEYKLNDNNELERRGIFVNLKSYSGNKHSRGAFGANSDVVLYGDLTIKGNLLRLMHEIAHAWQEAYNKDFIGAKFDNFYINVVSILETLEDFHQADCHLYDRILLKALENKGIEIDIDNFLDLGQKIDADKIKLKSISQQIFIIKTDQFHQLIKDYETEERDAWAHAIRVIRFLRKKGIDLEPSLKTLDDFKGVVDFHLGIYQNTIENMISSKRGVRFTRRQVCDER